MTTVVTDGLLVGVDVSPAMVTFCEARYRSLDDGIGWVS